MLFNSYVFVLLFLPLTLLGYYGLNIVGARWAARHTGAGGDGYNAGRLWLLCMSLWFYAYFNFWYLFIILFSILFNYGASRLIKKTAAPGAKKALLVLALAVNLGVLFYYKYFNFFVDNINAVFSLSLAVRQVVLPLGISFFTFQQLSYVIDSYKGEVPNYNLLDYALFVSFFPQLIAGPIVTHDEIVPQFADTTKKNLRAENMARGLLAFSFGMAKKVLLADTFGSAVNWGYAHVAELDATNSLLVMLFYTLQIYFDFSGYCDMATGLGLMFNIDITQNFNSPYKALDINQFWERWHMTLTRFFTRYVYIPLGGNRKGVARTVLNMLAVFLLSGLWHGASWTFVFWGAMHGVFAVFTRLFKKRFARLHPALGWLFTFVFVNVAWVFFRAETFGEAGTLLYNIAKMDFGPILPEISAPFVLQEVGWVTSLLRIDILGRNPNWMLAAFTLFGLVAVMGMKNTNQRIEGFKAKAGSAVLCSLLLWWCIISFSGVSTFLYFNF